MQGNESAYFQCGRLTVPETLDAKVEIVYNNADTRDCDDNTIKFFMGNEIQVPLNECESNCVQIIDKSNGLIEGVTAGLNFAPDNYGVVIGIICSSSVPHLSPRITITSLRLYTE